MEQLPYREAAAAEGGDRPGWCRDSLGDGGGPAGDSAACNGSCARPLEEDDHDRDRSFPSPASLRPDGSCSGSCRHRGPAATAGLPEEGEEEGGGGEGRGGRRPRRRQRLRSAPKERDEAGASRRHRPPPRRSPGSGQGSPRPAEGPVGSQWPLAAALARLRLLHSCCRLGTGDTGWVPAGARGWGQRLRGGSWRAARGLRATAGLTLRFLYMLFALLVLLLMLLLGALRLCWRQGAAVLAGSRTWMLLEGSRLGQHLRDWVQKEAASAPGGAPGAGEEVTRLVAMAEVPEEELNPFQVLGVEATATDAELRRAYRRLAVLVHPDKSQHPRAEAAFKVLRAAWDIVSSPERRKEHEMQRLARTELRRSVGEFLRRLQDELREAMNTMSCSKCGGRHRRFELAREPRRGRFCGECGGLHPAEEGDFWAESSLLGLKITFLAVMEGRVYDITEWAACQRVAIAPDTHRVPYHISCGARGPAPAGRQRGSPPSADELQDFLARVFRGGSGATPGGPFPPPPPAATPGGAAAAAPGAPPRADSAVPKGEAKHKRRKKTRRPLQR